MMTWPASGRSSQMMQRSSRAFPEPLGPTMQTVSPGITVRLTSARASEAPNRLLSPRSWTAGAALASGGIPDPLRPSFAPSDALLDAGAEGPVQQRRHGERLEWHEVERLHGVGGVRQLGHGDDRQERRVLDELDELVAEHRAGRERNLRQDDAPDQPEPGEADGARGLGLAG